MGKWGIVGLLYLLGSLVVSAKLTELAKPPDWSRLDSFQKSISKQEFLIQLNEVYCPRESWWSPWIEIEENRARIRKKNGIMFKQRRQTSNNAKEEWPLDLEGRSEVLNYSFHPLWNF